MFPILLPYNRELKWIFGGFVSFDLHNMPTTLKMQNIYFFCETNRVVNSITTPPPPPKSQYFVGPPFAAITAASL
jgi:hypothetical protein